MYIDENGGIPHEITVEMDGERYTAEENYDYHHDGHLDSAVVDTPDGGEIVYTDTHGTGQADLLTEFDAHGQAVVQARFDVTTGEWVDTGVHADPASASSPGSMTVDTGNGLRDVGPATEDTDGDGKPDTAVVRDDQGGTWLYTDTDGDGHADVAVEITPTGEISIFQHSGDQGWAQTQHGHLDSHGQFTPDSVSGEIPGERTQNVGWNGDESMPADRAPAAGGVVRIDAATGEWINVV